MGAVMKFGIHNPSWLFGQDPAGIFDAVKAKAQSGRNPRMDHPIRIGNVGEASAPAGTNRSPVNTAESSRRGPQ